MQPIKCCRNCRHYNRTNGMCDANIIEVDESPIDDALWDAVSLLSEEGKIAQLCEELDSGSNRWNRSKSYIEAFLRNNLHFLHKPTVEIRIADDIHFYCCNWE